MSLYNWHEVGDVPAAAGVYAWYYRPEITTQDVKLVIDELRSLKEVQDIIRAKSTVRKFLEEHIFRYFNETPYQASIFGKLKPKYEGLFEHAPTVSESLIDRLLEDPERIASIRAILELSAPYAASPLYIGMSENLRVRLRTHKRLIERYGELGAGSTGLETRDQSFAKEIRTRRIPPPRLFVAVSLVSGNYVDIENILNRIHYPLLGRN